MGDGLSGPWDLPPFPDHGDTNADLTYAAVGRAMSEWEEVELYLARLYAAFLGIPPIEAIARPEYTRVAVARERSRVIEEVAHAYFVRHPDQTLESEFETLICDARNFAARRNDIAHGVVKLAWGQFDDSMLGAALARKEVMLLPGTYMFKKFDDKRMPAYMLSSVEINRFAEHFRAFRFERIEPLIIRIARRLLP
ncbi:MAG: hypothetical protein WA459_15915 [Stellaceae bacterium]